MLFDILVSNLYRTSVYRMAFCQIVLLKAGIWRYIFLEIMLMFLVNTGFGLSPPSANVLPL
jgi:hypothetical protein